MYSLITINDLQLESITTFIIVGIQSLLRMQFLTYRNGNHRRVIVWRIYSYCTRRRCDCHCCSARNKIQGRKSQVQWCHPSCRAQEEETLTPDGYGGWSCTKSGCHAYSGSMPIPAATNPCPVLEISTPLLLARLLHQTWPLYSFQLPQEQPGQLLHQALQRQVLILAVVPF